VTVTLPPEAAAAGPDARFGRFIRTVRVGMGGMGEVWKAWDVEVGRWVALKFLRSGDAEEIVRFKREAHAAGRLAHPNIAAIYEVGEGQGRPFIAMQFVDGGTLRALGGPMATRLRLLADASRAVQFAHDHGIIHRDLKPDNLMITTRAGAPHLYVMDFGLAKVTAAASSLSASGMAIGTPAYMPPEQARGDVRAVDGRSDVYALGATMYEVACGSPPFEGPDALTVLLRVASDDPIPLRTRAPGIDADVEAIVQKCMEKEPARRYATAGALADDIERFLRGEAPLAAASAARWSRRAGRLRSWLSRHRLLTAVGAAGIVVAVAGLVTFRAWRRESLSVRSGIEAGERARPHIDEGDRHAGDARLLAQEPVPDTTRITATLTAAVAAFDAALREQPGSVDALSHRADAKAALGDLAAAERDVTAAIGLRDTPALRLQRAWLRTQQYEARRELALPICLSGVVERILLPAETAETGTLREQALGDLALAGKGEQRTLVEGVLLLAEGRAADAFDKLDEVVRTRSFDPAALMYRALAALALADVPTAIEDLERSLQLRPASPRGVLALATCEYARGDLTACATLVDRAAALGADGVAVLRLQGAIAAGKADVDAAAALFDRALAKKPADAFTRILMLLVRRRELERERVDHVFEVGESLPDRAHAAELDDMLQPVLSSPGCPALAWLYHGQNLLALDRHADAEAALTKAVERDSSIDLAFLWRAIARVRQGSWAGAMDDFIQFEDIEGRSAEGHGRLCSIIREAADGNALAARLDEAGTADVAASAAPRYLRYKIFHHDSTAPGALASAVKVAEGWRKLYFEAVLFGGKGRAAEAEAARRELKRLRPESRGIVWVRSEHDASISTEEFRARCRANPLDSATQYNWAAHYLRAGRGDEAIPLLIRNTYFYGRGMATDDLARNVLWTGDARQVQRALRLVAKPWWLWEALAERYLDIGDPEAALRAIEQANLLMPESGALRLTRIRILLALKRDVAASLADVARIIAKNKTLPPEALRTLTACCWAAGKKEEAAALLEGNPHFPRDKAAATARSMRAYAASGHWKFKANELYAELPEIMLEALDLEGLLRVVEDLWPLLNLHGRGAYLVWRARAHELLGRRDDAVRDLDQALPMLGDDHRLDSYFARLYADAGRYEDARRFLNADPQPVDHLINLRILVATGQGDRAGPSIEVLRRMGSRMAGERLLGPAISRAEFERLVAEAGRAK